ncbi:MAG: hypothetical protein WCP99_24140, partial [Burkholderiales bacterium]
EMQSITQSATARHELEKTLWQLGLLGTPLLFAVNYSAAHKLLDAPEEIQDRLLLKPMILLPSLPDSQDWADYLNEVGRILGPTLHCDLIANRNQLFNFTAGLRRYVILLIVRAYQLAWSENRRFVTMQDLNRAYGNGDYGVARKRVERIVKELICGGASGKTSQDDCPFPIPEAISQAYARHDKEHKAREFSKSFIAQELAAEARARNLNDGGVAQATFAPKMSKTSSKSRSNRSKTAAELHEAEIRSKSHGK